MSTTPANTPKDQFPMEQSFMDQTKMDLEVTTNDKVVLQEGAKVDKRGDFAVALPGTLSTYERVEKGTRTALIYWDGWLTAQDALGVEKEKEDGDYFGEKEKPNKKIVRMVSLDPAPNGKNWSYGPNGEIVYHKTAFVGIFDKKSVHSQMVNIVSQYGSVMNAPGKAASLPRVQSGPVVGTHYDLAKGQKSAYADVSQTGPLSKGSRSGTPKSPSPKSGYADVGATPSGAGVGINLASKASMIGNFQQKRNCSAYMEAGGAKSLCGGVRTTATSGAVGDQQGRGYPNDGYSGPWGANGAPFRKNWKIENGKVVYIATGFVGVFDPPAGKKPPKGAVSKGGNVRDLEDGSLVEEQEGAIKIGTPPPSPGCVSGGVIGNFHQKHNSSAYMSVGAGSQPAMVPPRKNWSGTSGSDEPEAALKAGPMPPLPGSVAGAQVGNFHQKQNCSAYLSVGGSGAGNHSAAIPLRKNWNLDKGSGSSGGDEQEGAVKAGSTLPLTGFAAGGQLGNFYQKQNSSAYLSVGTAGAGSQPATTPPRKKWQIENGKIKYFPTGFVSGSISRAKANVTSGYLVLDLKKKS